MTVFISALLTSLEPQQLAMLDVILTAATESKLE